MKNSKLLVSYNIFKSLSFIFFFIVIVTISMFLGLIIVKGGKNISFSFIFNKPSGFPIGIDGGVFPALIGTIYFTLIASVFASVISFMIATYISFYCKKSTFINSIQVVIGIIAGVPSILLGLFGYQFFVVTLGFGVSLLSGGLTLGLMIFPYIEIRFERMFYDINEIYRINNLALGVNEFYYIFHLVIPISWKRILSIISLAASLAMGATAPILLTGGVLYAKAPDSILSPSMALPLHLYHLVGENISMDNAFATAGVLMILLICLNILPLLFSSVKKGTLKC